MCVIYRLFGIYTITALFEYSYLVFAASTDRYSVCRALYRVVPYYRSGTVIWQKKGRLRAFIERHFGGSKPLQIFTKLRPIIVYNIYTIVGWAFKRKSSAARSALNLTAETQASSAKVHSIGTTEPIRPGGTPAQTSPFISLA